MFLTKLSSLHIHIKDCEEGQIDGKIHKCNRAVGRG